MKINKNNKKFFQLKILLILLLLLTSAYNAISDHIYDTMESLTFNPVGSGSRAIGMGSAFIAIADDATAASWNPAGLIQLKTPEISVVCDFSNWIEKNEFFMNREQSASSQMYEKNINYFSLTYPFRLLNRDMILSLNYQHLFEFEYELNMKSEKKYTQISQYSISQDGKLYALGIALCFQLKPELSVGITFNFWENWPGSNGWEQTTRGVMPVNEEIYFDDSIFHKYSFKGFNLNIGILWDITDYFRIGAVIKTPFTADLEHTTIFTYLSPLSSGQNPPNIYSEKLDMPLSYGLGIAYRFSDNFTLSTDFYSTNWSKLILTDQEGGKYSFINGKKIEQSNVKPTYHIRSGVEYLIMNKRLEYTIPIRGGIFYDPMPADGSPDDYYGLSLGTGISIAPYVFDIAFQYKFGINVGESKLKSFNFSQNIHELRFYSSFIYHF